MSRFKVFSVVIHIAGWLLFMAFPLVFLNSRSLYNTSISSFLQKPAYWLFCITYIALFYSNAYLFIPQFFLKKKYLIYSIICIVLLGSVYMLRPFDKLLRSTEDLRMRNGMMMPGPPPFDRPHFGDHDPDGAPPDTLNRFNKPPHFQSGSLAQKQASNSTADQ